MSAKLYPVDLKQLDDAEVVDVEFHIDPSERAEHVVARFFKKSTQNLSNRDLVLMVVDQVLRSTGMSTGNRNMLWAQLKQVDVTRVRVPVSVYKRLRGSNLITSLTDVCVWVGGGVLTVAVYDAWTTKTPVGADAIYYEPFDESILNDRADRS